MSKSPPTTEPQTPLPNVTYAVCAVTRRRFPVGAKPTRQRLQPEAIGAASGVAIGAIGVSGAPGGQFDEECARAALAKIQDQTKSPREASFTLRERFASPPESNATSKLTLRA
jgi:hypothetical protein